MKHTFIYSLLAACLLPASIEAQQLIPDTGRLPEITWDTQSLLVDGHRVMPVMGEMHYSRIPAAEWRTELKKMQEGGVNIVATYIFWNHIEEIESQYDWSGQRDLRAFLEVCREVKMPVVIRIGPWCHGEARMGGIPDWVFTKNCETRVEDPVFLELTADWYRQVFTQVQGLQWKDGGPVMGCQFDNEYWGHGSYLMALKKIANGIGFDLPIYTRTGWPELMSPVPYGSMLPLFGDYADGFWERSTKEAVGSFWQAFHFKPYRIGADMGDLDAKKKGEQKEAKGDEQGYPYFTCELGGGMMPSYNRRVYMYPEDAYSMAVVKLGCGSNLLGYYMYHGGTNPDGKLTHLNETQKTVATNYNELPVKTYDFQAPLGEFGQKNPHFYTLRKLHLFMQTFGETLAPMEAHFPMASQPLKQGDDSYLRWTYRSLDDSAFVFINNYERFQNLTDKKSVRFDVCGVRFPQRSITIPAGTMAILPVNIRMEDIHLRYATAQVIARNRNAEGRMQLFLQKLEGIDAELCINGKVMKKVKPQGESKPVYQSEHTDVFLLTEEQANRFRLVPEQAVQTAEVAFRKVKEAGPLRAITIGVSGVAEQPVDADFDHAAVYYIDVPSHEGLLDIAYRGDVARLYADGKLIDDNFYNGRTFQYGLWRLPEDCKQLELRILPIQRDAPIYFPREADNCPGEDLISVKYFSY